MKKLYTILTMVAVFFSAAAFGQSRCTVDFTNQTPGLSPSDQDSVDCIERNAAYSYTYQFKNLSSFDPGTGPVTIEWIRFDSAVNMPCGITWSSSKAGNQYNGGENGCIQFQGTTSDTTGQYRITLWLNAKVSISPVPIPQPASTIGIVPILRVKEAAGACPAVDTASGSSLNRTSTCNSGETMFTSINSLSEEVSELGIYPNPIFDAGTVGFTSEVSGAFTVNIFDMTGQMIQSYPVEVNQGANMQVIDARNMSSGLYLYTMTDGVRSISKQFIVSK